MRLPRGVNRSVTISTEMCSPPNNESAAASMHACDQQVPDQLVGPRNRRTEHVSPNDRIADRRERCEHRRCRKRERDARNPARQPFQH